MRRTKLPITAVDSLPWKNNATAISGEKYGYNELKFVKTTRDAEAGPWNQQFE